MHSVHRGAKVAVVVAHDAIVRQAMWLRLQHDSKLQPEQLGSMPRLTSTGCKLHALPTRGREAA